MSTTTSQGMRPGTTERLAMPVCRMVRTRSGSRYRIEGRRVRKLRHDAADEDFILIDTRNDRLRYTDGERLFVSSPIVTTRAEPTA
jgi:hypothetical protein